QGISGCGFESPLESAYKMILRSQKDNERQYGFVRDHALLMIVFVTDEGDCSYNSEYDEIFLPPSMGGNQVFWSDPDASAPTSAVCWNAGVACTGAGPYDECHAQDKGVDGGEATTDIDAVLQPVSRYVDFLAQLEADKQALDPAARVLVAVIGGVPPGYDKGVDIPYAPASDPETQRNFGIGPACTKADGIGIAVPAVREREVAEAFTSDGSRNLWSVCDPSLDGALAGVTQMIAAHVGGG
ncbi:MAG TPA: VWA domain-containing protein, partial [Nannocystaceae bacterium]|nr:VWA domain-containing protein [Nannocystaceae bacterium]